MSEKTVTVTAELPESQARALAQFVKRAGYADCRVNAVSGEEAYQMVYALGKIQDALAEQGYAPR